VTIHRSERPVIGFGLLVALLIAGCGGSVTSAPSTRYEAARYTISVPDSLALKAVEEDPARMWRTNLVGLTDGHGVIAVQTTTAPCDGSAIAPAAQAMSRALGSPMPLSSKRLGSNDVALISGRFGASPGTVAAMCATTVVLTVVGTGVDEAIVESVIASIVVRDPPGDPARPPSAAPSS
jgi:hypothetical protein